MGYIIKTGSSENTYTSMRMSSSPTSVGSDEVYVTSLDGLSFQFMSKVSPRDVLSELESWVMTRDDDWIFNWSNQISLLRNSFIWWSNNNNIHAKNKILSLVENLRQFSGFEEEIILYLLSNVNEVVY